MEKYTLQNDNIDNFTPNHVIKTEKLWKNYYVEKPIIVNQ